MRRIIDPATKRLSYQGVPPAFSTQGVTKRQRKRAKANRHIKTMEAQK